MCNLKNIQWYLAVCTANNYIYLVGLLHESKANIARRIACKFAACSDGYLIV